jgi:hypothetical protein
MAKECTLLSDSYDGRHLRLSCVQTPNRTTNSSTISWTLSSVGGTSNYYSVGPTTVLIAGKQVYYKARVNWGEKIFPAAIGSVSGEIIVNHDSAGNKSIPVSLKTVVYHGSGSVSTEAITWELDRIPPESTFGEITGNIIGKQMTVNITRHDSSFTHQLWYKVGNSQWYDLGTGIGTSKAFTIDIATVEQIPTSMSGTLQLCLRTFSGNSQIGSDVYKDVTVSVPEYTPTIKSISLIGHDLLDGAYVQGKSTVSVNISAASDFGGDIKSYSCTLDGKTYDKGSFRSSVLSAGNKVVSVTVTDTRGKTATRVSNEITVYEYALPTIVEFTLERQSDETTVVAHLKGSVSPIGNKNTKSFTVTLNGITQDVPADGYAVDGATTFENVPTDNTLTATAKIVDWYTAASKNAVLPTVAVTMDFHHSGTGIAMGKVAEHENLLDVNWDIKYRGGIINDFVVEQGVNGIWTYRKWHSGIAECWGIHTQTGVEVKNPWGSLFESAGHVVNLPIGLFNATPQFFITLAGTGEASGVMLETYSLGSATQSPNMAVIRPVAATVGTVQTSIFAKGRWK